MLVLPVSPKNIKLARQIIKKGGIIIYPTDTIYGLGADIFNQQAVKKIIDIKGRKKTNPISVMISDFLQIKKIASVNARQAKIIKTLLPGPFTVILTKNKSISDLLTAKRKTIGVRWPKLKICQALAKNLPITTTSANLSGQPNTLSVNKLNKIFKNKVDLMLVGGKMSGRASTIIDLTVGPFKILR
ncbi:MAG: L-threonylcarbamoyladenylate synthase [Patescibacteria group bacterium]|nr:L-threonylcarbamoyladenylate synthase [Patescibacteria group bacterium]MDD5121158.1 L-threonylcarbamoyladenylate synthase [Patescibacteria group bacterium]MDD5221673.1 L-threonylcarbamoyladenylate synthase [Patescibacteria group bacterium]MDD5395923.1 L-threonylcarbamoyladenylate synthase [Patescibacteria group bacterium]